MIAYATVQKPPQAIPCTIREVIARARNTEVDSIRSNKPKSIVEIPNKRQEMNNNLILPQTFIILAKIKLGMIEPSGKTLKMRPMREWETPLLLANRGKMEKGME